MIPLGRWPVVEKIILRRAEGTVAGLSINHPRLMNTHNTLTLRLLDTCIEELGDKEGARAIAVTSTGAGANAKLGQTEMVHDHIPGSRGTHL